VNDEEGKGKLHRRKRKSTEQENIRGSRLRDLHQKVVHKEEIFPLESSAERAKKANGTASAQK